MMVGRVETAWLGRVKDWRRLAGSGIVRAASFVQLLETVGATTAKASRRSASCGTDVGTTRIRQLGGKAAGIRPRWTPGQATDDGRRRGWVRPRGTAHDAPKARKRPPQEQLLFASSAARLEAQRLCRTWGSCSSLVLLWKRGPRLRKTKKVLFSGRCC